MSYLQQKHTWLNDGLIKPEKGDDRDLSIIAHYERRRNLSRINGSTFLLSRGKTRQRFFTEDSRRYITTREQLAISRGFRLDRGGLFDGVGRRFTRARKDSAFDSIQMGWWKMRRASFGIGGFITSIPDKISFRVSPVKMWNFSLVGAMIFGMITMSMMYRYLGQIASADSDSMKVASATVVQDLSLGSLLLEENDREDKQAEKGVFPIESFQEQKAPVSFVVNTDDRLSAEDKAFKESASKLVEGYPIEKMLPYILQQDRKVAAYLIAIAKKESNWGKRVPVYEGEDCFNYWGYRGVRKVMGTGGHTCFENPKDAVETVGKRLNTLVVEKKLDTPEKLIVWKCGSSCAGHGQESVRKWISDVDMYIDKLKKKV